MKKILIFLFWGAFSLAAFSQPKKVAVYVTGEDAGINKVFGSKLVSAFARSEQYSAVERTIEFLSQLSKEQNYQHSGAVDDRDLSRLGKQFGVQYVCVAEISDVFGEKFVSARLIDVETAEIVNTYDVGGKMSDISECIKMANEIAMNFNNESTQSSISDVGKASVQETEESMAIPMVQENNSYIYDMSQTIEYDFGQILEDGGAVSHIFILPIRYEDISSISASCRCIIPQGEQDSTNPNLTRVIVEYLPKGRLGRFSKTTIIQMKNGETHKVCVKGNVAL